MSFDKMRILLSNDDGIDAPGLAVLEEIARTLTDDVWVVAPESQQSAAGHSLTLRRPLQVRPHGHQRFSIDGTPTDCVILALQRIMREKKPDLVLSGVNYGSNLAQSITYSGTVAVAMEATLMGIPAIAMSQDIVDAIGPRWDVARQFGPEIIRKLWDHGWPEGVLMNVNFPPIDVSEVAGIKIVRQGLRDEYDALVDYKDPRGRECYWIGPEPFFDPGETYTDIGAIHHRLIPITPLHLDYTHEETLEKLKKAFHPEL